MSKRRRGFPSETNVKRGPRSVKGGEKELLERLGNNDLCPCGSGRRFQALLPLERQLSTAPGATTTSGSAERARGGETVTSSAKTFPRGASSAGAGPRNYVEDTSGRELELCNCYDEDCDRIENFEPRDPRARGLRRADQPRVRGRLGGAPGQLAARG
jgi:hypothetical protein